MNRRKIGKFGLAALATVAWPFPALAYLDRPIRLVVPFSPGGATGVVGRLWADAWKTVASELARRTPAIDSTGFKTQ